MALKPLCTFDKLRMIVELIEGGHSPIAYFLVTQFGRDVKNPDPVIAKFLHNPDRKYWSEFEPLLSDLKDQLYRTLPNDPQ